MTYAISTTDSEATQAAAERLSQWLHGGEVIELASDLGGGKTTFVQGLVRGLGYTGEVTSPTFTLNRIYNLGPELAVHHYDLYRLGQSGVVGDELAESLADPAVITAIEWAGLVADELPADRLRIEFIPTGEQTRELRFTAGGPRSSQLLERFQA